MGDFIVQNQDLITWLQESMGGASQNAFTANLISAIEGNSNFNASEKWLYRNFIRQFQENDVFLASEWLGDYVYSGAQSQNQFLKFFPFLRDLVEGGLLVDGI